MIFHLYPCTYADSQALIIPAMIFSQVDDLHLWSLMAEDRYLLRTVVAQHGIFHVYFFLKY